MTFNRAKTKPGTIVPAMPPLDGIQDPAARNAIRALADGW